MKVFRNNNFHASQEVKENYVVCILTFLHYYIKMWSTSIKKQKWMWNLLKEFKKWKNSSDISRLYSVNSNEWLIYQYIFFYMIIIFTYRKIYFYLYTVGKKNYYEKFNIFTCRIVSPEINLWFYYYRLCKPRLAKV